MVDVNDVIKVMATKFVMFCRRPGHIRPRSDDGVGGHLRHVPWYGHQRHRGARHKLPLQRQWHGRPGQRGQLMRGPGDIHNDQITCIENLEEQ